MKKQYRMFLIIATICIVGALSVFVIWLFKPIKNQMPSVEQYKDSEYYDSSDLKEGSHWASFHQ